MAKPLAAPPAWASDLNFTNGPFIGQPTKDPAGIPVAIANEGFIPGPLNAMAAEHVNDWLNQITQWIAWVEAGSTTADLTAHLVETNAAGEVRLATAILGGTASVSVALNVIQNTANPLAAVINASGTASTGLRILQSGDLAACALDVRSTNPAATLSTVKSQYLGTNAAAAALEGFAGAAGMGVRGIALGSGVGVYAESSSGTAVRVDGIAGDPGGTIAGDLNYRSDLGAFTLRQAHPNTGIESTLGAWASGTGLVGGLRTTTSDIDVPQASTVDLANKAIELSNGQVIAVMFASPWTSTGIGAGARGAVSIKIDQPTLGTVTLGLHSIHYNGTNPLITQASASTSMLVAFGASETGTHTVRVEHQTGSPQPDVRWFKPGLIILGDLLAW